MTEKPEKPFELNLPPRRAIGSTDNAPQSAETPDGARPDSFVLIDGSVDAGKPAASDLTPDMVDDIDKGGRRLAEDMDDKGYQPVILFGNAFSGKTSLLLSLLATIRTEASLDTGLTLAPPVLSNTSRYGEYIRTQAEAFWGKRTQEFIEGIAAPKTATELPFFIPVTLSPGNRPEAHFAFMESNGEWYRANRDTDKLFPALRKQIEDFISNYQGGIIFIHLVPYTQQHVRSATYDQSSDSLELREASLAIDGALQAYKRIRTDKSKDRHIMLVTKWDAHLPAEDTVDTLTDPDQEDVEIFIAQRYSQALASYKGLKLRPDQYFLNSYCAGIMSVEGVLSLKPGSELREAVIQYPIRLWTWLYKSALRNAGMQEVEPFPTPNPPPAIVRLFRSVMDRLF